MAAFDHRIARVVGLRLAKPFGILAELCRRPVVVATRPGQRKGLNQQAAENRGSGFMPRSPYCKY